MVFANQLQKLQRGEVASAFRSIVQTSIPFKTRCRAYPRYESSDANVVLRICPGERDQSIQETGFDAFLKTQESGSPPCGLIFQSEHSRLAGALAQALRPQCFGNLNADVIAAIAHHDVGWDASDRQQIESLELRPPTSFTSASAENTLPCWIGSIAAGRELGGLAAVLISRHCCLLGTGSKRHASFVDEETKRRREMERALTYRPEDLDRWTAALGFCDLLSLYLCSGSKCSVSLPLGHPADHENKRHVSLSWLNGQPSLPDTVFSNPSDFRAAVLVTPKHAQTATSRDQMKKFPGTSVRVACLLRRKVSQKIAFAFRLRRSTGPSLP